MLEQAVVSRIMVYPVKSLDGQAIDAVNVLQSGALAFDRRWAMFDPAERYVNGKRYASVHRIRSRIDLTQQTISLCADHAPGPNDCVFSFNEDRKKIEKWLSDFFSFAVTLKENTTTGFPDDEVALGPTIISVATMNEIAQWFELPIDEVRARFRTNIEIDGVPPFWEDRLFGSNETSVKFIIGEVNFDGVGPSDRCVVPARSSQSGAMDAQFVQRFRERRKSTMPDWVERSRFKSFYQLAINTKVSVNPDLKLIKIGDFLRILSEMSLPQILETFPTTS